MASSRLIVGFADASSRGRHRCGAVGAHPRHASAADRGGRSSSRWPLPRVRAPDQRLMGTLTFVLGGGDWWTVELDTADATPGRLASGAIELTGRLLVVLRAT